MTKAHKIMLGGATAIVVGAALIDCGLIATGVGLGFCGLWTVMIGPMLSEI